MSFYRWSKPVDFDNILEICSQTLKIYSNLVLLVGTEIYHIRNVNERKENKVLIKTLTFNNTYNIEWALTHFQGKCDVILIIKWEILSLATEYIRSSNEGLNLEHSVDWRCYDNIAMKYCEVNISQLWMRI